MPTQIIPELTPLLPWLDRAGLAVFAASGALAATRTRRTIVTACFFACVTGIGGGAARDILIGAPVYWMHNPEPLAICLSIAVLVWLSPNRLWSASALDWFDAIGLAAYAVYGADKAVAYGVPLLPAAVMGVVTACLGGIIRDVVAGVPSMILRPEIYITAAALASGLFIVLDRLGLPAPWPVAIGLAGGFGLRAAAIVRGLALPAYPGRS